ncbi:excalibur calcium-binding domain-containing protein [Micromonospora sp. NPDC049559]|uniref:excalibur calcium-binding domain-containing protein n=1 Tax=Micromonospora sp. NPDC049559 TaxID=3155923 RepID=UPI00343C5C70
MSQPPFGDPPPPARAASYGRGNQSAGRYRRTGQTPGSGAVTAGTSPTDERPDADQPDTDQPDTDQPGVRSWTVRRSSGKRRVAVESTATPSDATPPDPAPTRSGVPASRWLVAAGFVLTLALGVAVLSVFLGGASRPTATGPGGATPWQTPAPIVSGGPPGVAPEKRPPAWDAPDQRQPVRPAAETYGRPPSTPTRTTRPGTSPGERSEQPSGGQGSPPYYRNCAQAHKAGVTPLRSTDPGYSPRLDRDGDGVACEQGNRDEPEESA